MLHCNLLTVPRQIHHCKHFLLNKFNKAGPLKHSPVASVTSIPVSTGYGWLWYDLIVIWYVMKSGGYVHVPAWYAFF